TELADKLRKWIGADERLLPQGTKMWMLLLCLAGTLLSGLPFFETLSPIGIVSRAVAFGSYGGILILAGIVLIEIIFARRVWCRSLCPLGGFYSLVGRHARLRVGYLPERCTQCGECTQACPVEEVLQPCLAGDAAEVVSGDCIRCAACIDVCREKALKVSYRIFH
ncbi:MAG: 4Fe-4S dicluster domain-containing protein, partial [Geobacter sp.]|nr:4Fe-4S dicluster domain-containing protein [Geobacter sp.]